MISRYQVALHLNDMISRYDQVVLHLNDTSHKFWLYNWSHLIRTYWYEYIQYSIFIQYSILIRSYWTQESTSARRKPSGPRVADPYTEEDRFDLYLISNQSARDAQMPHNYGIQSVTTTSPALQCCQYSWLSERSFLWFSASAGFEISLAIACLLCHLS